MIIDGHALAFRAHFAMVRQNLTNADGMPIETVHGFFRLLVKLLRDRKPKYLLVTFDPPRKTFRHEAYVEYKANREEAPPELKAQFDEVQEIVGKLGLPMYIPHNEEADDVIATLAHRLHDSASTSTSLSAMDEVPEVEIISSDKDLFNILYPGVIMLRSKKGVSEFYEFGEQKVFEEIGVTRAQVPDYMALTGDSSDNIPGVKGIGPKGASKLIFDYGSLDGIYENIDKITPAGTQKKLAENKEAAYESQFLVTLKKDVELPFVKVDKTKHSVDLSALLVDAEKIGPLVKVFREKGYNTLYKEWSDLFSGGRLDTINHSATGSSASGASMDSAGSPTSTSATGGKNDSMSDTGAGSVVGNILSLARIVKTEEDLASLLEVLKGVRELAFDTETTSVDAMRAELVGVSLAWRSIIPVPELEKRIAAGMYIKGEKPLRVPEAVSVRPIQSVYIPLNFDREHEAGFEYQEVGDPEKMLAQLKSLLENPKIEKIAQNAKYDLKVLKRHGVNVENVRYDTMLLNFLLYAGEKRHNLDDMALDYLDHETIKYSDIAGKGQKQKPLVQLELETLARYACEDAEVTFALKEILWERVLESDAKRTKEKTSSEKPIESESAGSSKDKKHADGEIVIAGGSSISLPMTSAQIYQHIDLPMLTVLQNMEERGVKLDTKRIEDLKEQYTKRMREREKRVYELAGEEFNVNSTKELSAILFEKLGIATKKKTSGGKLSTAADALEDIRSEHEIVDELLNYRALFKLVSTYLEAWPEFIHPQSGRVHTSFSQVIAATARLSSHDPNLQNIPVRGEDGNALRTAFVAEKGFSLLSLDYSQIELRILAHYSRDEHLMNAYRDDEDIHDQSTYLLFRNRFDAKAGTWLSDSTDDAAEPAYEIDFDILNKMKATKEFSDYRAQAKILNFSIVYGVTDFGLSENLRIPRGEAKQLIEMYFTAFPGIRRYMDDMVERVQGQSYSQNIVGRRRVIHGLDQKNRFAREAAKRLAINTPIQSSAADIIKVAMIDIESEMLRRKLKSRMLLQIHDELLFEVDDSERDEVFALVKERMENAVPLSVPLRVDGAFGKSWADAKG